MVALTTRWLLGAGLLALSGMRSANAVPIPQPVSVNPAFQAIDEMENLHKRACSGDNLLRLLRSTANLPEALPFCSTYLGLPASTARATLVPTV